MKTTEHVEQLLRQGRKPKELVELGFPKSIVTRVRRQLKEEKGGVKQKRRQVKANATPNGGGGAMPRKGTAPITTVPSTSAVDDIESDPEIVQLKKEIRKAELEMALGRAKTPPEVAALVASARLFGTDRQEDCIYRRDGYCIVRSWASQHEIPEGIGEPVFIQEDEPNWRVKPSCLYCAVCTALLEDHIDYLRSAIK